MLLFSKRRRYEREHMLAQLDALHKVPEIPEMGLDFVPKQFLRISDRPTTIFDGVVQECDRFFAHTTPQEFEQYNNRIVFESNLLTNVLENNVVYANFFPARNRDKAVIILPYWNAVGSPFDRIAFAFATCGIAALRFSLPYHDCRRPADWPIAKYMVSANIGRTIQSIRQAVLDVRCGIDWLSSLGYKKIAIVGVSIGSCVATIAAALDKRVGAIAQLLMAGNFSEVVWTGAATTHIRESFNDYIDLPQLKRLWAAISPDTYVPKLAANGTDILMITGAYDSVFLPRLTDELVESYNAHSVNYRWKVLNCGHYTLADIPYNWFAFITVLRWLRRTVR